MLPPTPPPKKDIPALILRTLNAEENFTAVAIKDLEMGRLPVIIHVGSHGNQCPSNKEAEGDLMQAEKACIDGGRDWSDATTRQETPAATRKLEEARNGFSPGACTEGVALPQTVKIVCFLSHQVCGNLLQQPEEPDTIVN